MSRDIRAFALFFYALACLPHTVMREWWIKLDGYCRILIHRADRGVHVPFTGEVSDLHGSSHSVCRRCVVVLCKPGD